MTQRKRCKKPLILIVGFTVLALVVVNYCGDLIVINQSNSLPSGFYMLSQEQVKVGTIVEFKPPQIATDYAVNRWGDMPTNVQFLKRVAAVEGDYVDATGDTLLINGFTMGAILDKDSSGNSLPRWRESRTLLADEIFVFSDYDRSSFDSRYYGPIKRDQVLSVRTLLLAW